MMPINIIKSRTISYLISVIILGCSNIEKDKGKSTELWFENKDYDFGTVVEGDTVIYSFKFTNNSGSPIFLYSASQSCGCLVTDWPQDTIEIDQVGEINVMFVTAGYQGYQEKYISLRGNTIPAISQLRIKGIVR